ARALVGTEGTCVTILEASLRLVHSPPKRSLVVLGYPDIYAACDDIPLILEYAPIGLEGMDDRMIADMQKRRLPPAEVALLPPGNGWPLVEFGAETREAANALAQALMARLAKEAHPPAMKLVESPTDGRGIWRVRESALGATALVPGQRP